MSTKQLFATPVVLLMSESRIDIPTISSVTTVSDRISA